MRIIEILFFFFICLPTAMVALAGVVLFYPRENKRVEYKDDTYDINFLRQ